MLANFIYLKALNLYVHYFSEFLRFETFHEFMPRYKIQNSLSVILILILVLVNDSNANSLHYVLFSPKNSTKSGNLSNISHTRRAFFAMQDERCDTRATQLQLAHRRRSSPFHLSILRQPDFTLAANFFPKLFKVKI